MQDLVCFVLTITGVIAFGYYSDYKQRNPRKK